MSDRPELDDDDAERRWWERTFKERQRRLEAHYGPSTTEDGRAGFVVPFPGGEMRLRTPGGCVLTCPPGGGHRGARADAWTLVTLGLSQPLDRTAVEVARRERRGRSGRGFELGLEVASRASWQPLALALLGDYAHDADPELCATARVAFFLGRAKGDESPWPYLGVPDQHPGVERVGTAAAVLLWPDRRGDVFETETGHFHVLTATVVTAEEWSLAQQFGSDRVLVLLYRAGLLQRSDPFRPSLTDDPTAMRQWTSIAAMTPKAAADELWASCGR